MKRLLLVAGLLCLGVNGLFAQTKVFVDFKYGNITTETTQLADGKIEKKTIDRGQTDFDLQMRDLIEFMLLEKNYSITRNARDAAYIVKLHSVVFSFSYPSYSIEVEIYGEAEKPLSRKLINGSGQPEWVVKATAEEVTKYLVGVIKP
jgi:hypothetical protein